MKHENRFQCYFLRVTPSVWLCHTISRNFITCHTILLISNFQTSFVSAFCRGKKNLVFITRKQHLFYIKKCENYLCPNTFNRKHRVGK